MTHQILPAPPGPILRLVRWTHRRPLVALAIFWSVAVLVTRIPPIRPREVPAVDLHLDKLFHFAGFAILAWLLMLALRRRMAFPASAILTLLILAVYGAADELTQPYFGRTADAWDYAADMLGCLAGLALACRGRRQRPAAGACVDSAA